MKVITMLDDSKKSVVISDKEDYFCLPFPPSINNYWRSVILKTRRGIQKKVILSKKAREYCADVALLLWGKKFKPIQSKMRADVLFYPPDNRRRDIDNFKKGLYDALQKAGVYNDDSQIKVEYTEMNEPIKPGFVLIKLTEIKVNNDE